MQAAVLDLYDPDRAQTLTRSGEIRPWAEFVGELRARLGPLGSKRGAGLRILTETIGSPTLAWQINQLRDRFPGAVWHQWDPTSSDNAREGTRLAFGTYASVQYRLDHAAVIVSLDADFLSSGPAQLRYTRDFARRRRAPGEGNRLYALESMPTPTGTKADHRLPLRASEIERAAYALAAGVGVRGMATPGVSGAQPAWIEAIRRDLFAHRGASLVIAGDDQPPSVHAVAHAINDLLGNAGQTVVYADPFEAAPANQMQSLRELTAALSAGEVELLAIIGGNPVFTAPADLDFGSALRNAGFAVHLSQYVDETSERCLWHVPEAHFLEAWSDGRAYDGTVSIVQPLIAPLYGGKSAHELIAAFSDEPDRAGYTLVREFWQRERASDDFEQFWRRTIHDGVMANTALTPRAMTPKGLEVIQPPQPSEGRIEISFRRDPAIADGRFANNGWLQELPKPLTSITWDNAVLASPALAARLGASTTPDSTAGEHGRLQSSVVELKYRGRSLRGPLFPIPGHPDGSVTLHLGYGRTRAGHLGTGIGFNAGVLLLSDAPSLARGAEITATGDFHELACTQYHHSMEGRDPVHVIERGASSVRAGPAPEPEPMASLYQEVPYPGHKWGMTIDLNACTGCKACVVACQAENTVPIVGKAEVLRGREMHWLRVDTYYRGPAEAPETYNQPVPCMQCEDAPCEVVCPVGATVHSAEGLNDMVYNRCVGTRYCSNNCPYKVRRFNFLPYQDWSTPSLKLGRNPDVTVRSRGVMEKCTYCIQRINEAKIAAGTEDRPIADGEIQTACQAVCPAEAIVFGDLNDPTSKVARAKADSRNYSLLDELNTRPRTTYLAAITNRNPALP
jgi:molybdopterin-containing oxidoreductase family iron-sulfur binding subunit